MCVDQNIWFAGMMVVVHGGGERETFSAVSAHPCGIFLEAWGLLRVGFGLLGLLSVFFCSVQDE